jgi:hypothetical protein
MTTYLGVAQAFGFTGTNTNPSTLVTSSATATSNVSQEDADNVAENTAQQVANSQAINDANIITQSINFVDQNLSTLGPKGIDYSNYQYWNSY